MIDPNADSLAVVPIFVNAGTALLPALVAGLTSVLAVLFKPKELVRACQRRPLTAGISGLVAVAGIVLVIVLMSGRPASARAMKASAPVRPVTDWAKYAVDALEREKAGLPLIMGAGKSAAVPDHAIGFRFDSGRCGCDGGPAPIKLAPLWKYDEEDAWFLSSPLVRGDRVYAAYAVKDVASVSGALFCLDAVTGKQIWKAEKIDDEQLKAFFSSPAVTKDGKYVVIGQGLHDDKDSDLLCYEANSGNPQGKLHWRVKTPLHIESSPAISGDMVVAGVGAIEDAAHKAVGNPGFVLAVRISDGKELWRCQVNDPESSPAIGEDGTVYIGSGFNGNAVVAIRSQTDDELSEKKLSRILWRTESPYPVTGAITLVGDLVLVGAGNSDYVVTNPHPAGLVLALDARTGKEKWRADMGDAVLGAIAARDGKLICPVRSGEVIALNQADGAILWRQRVSDKSPALAGPALAGNYVYAVSKDGFLAVLDLKDGTVIEKHQLNDQSKPAEMGLSLSSPLIAGGRLYVGSETGGLRCFVGGKVGQ